MYKFDIDTAGYLSGVVKVRRSIVVTLISLK